jgi:hypothetical protein
MPPSPVSTTAAVDVEGVKLFTTPTSTTTGELSGSTVICGYIVAPANAANYNTSLFFFVL